MKQTTGYYMAQAVSVVFHPLLLPSWLALLFYRGWLLVTLLYTAILPIGLIVALQKSGHIASLQLSQRQERNLPYALCLVCYLVFTLRLAHSGQPVFVSFVMAGVCLTLAAVMTINRSWQVSAHAAGMGGLMGMIIAYMLLKRSMLWPSLLVVAALSLLVIYARLYLNAHTWQQTVAGWLTGIVMTLFPYCLALCLRS